MKFEIHQYEFRYLNTAEWQDISEIDLMRRLCEFYDRVVPSIQKMIQGEQVMTQYAIYRLKCPEQKLSLQQTAKRRAIMTHLQPESASKIDPPARPFYFAKESQKGGSAGDAHRGNNSQNSVICASGWQVFEKDSEGSKAFKEYGQEGDPQPADGIQIQKK